MTRPLSLSRLFSLGDPRWGRGEGNTEGNGDNNSPSPSPAPASDPNPRPADRGTRGGGRDGQPPDLDEVWRDFNRKLSSLFGGKGGGPRDPFNRGGGTGGGLPNFTINRKMVGLGAGVVVALWLASGFYIVQEGQASLVLRFGEYQYTTTAGFKWRLPSPIESHEVVNIAQLRQTSIGVGAERGQGQSRDSLVLTQDENIVDIQFAIQYRVAEPEKYLFNNIRPDDIVTQAADTAMREVVGRSLSDAVLYENKEAIGREALAITQRIADRYDSGISIVNITIQNVQPPEEVQAAFNDAIKAAQDAERLKNEGQAYANDVIPRARGMADRLLEEAQAYNERVVAQAEGDANRFRSVVTEYNKAPAVTRERLYLETMQEVMGNVTKVMVDSKQGSMLYLPLDKILQQTNPATGTSGASGNMSATTPTSPSANGSAPLTPSPAAAPSLRDRFREVR